MSQKSAPHRERGNVFPAACVVGTVEQAEVVEGPTAVQPGDGAGSLGPLAPPEGGRGHKQAILMKYGLANMGCVFSKN